ncbi:MAG TPA: hypothetical protein VHQ45_19555 [Gemmatimonadaceae bacterium]|nr:hypothetical protein [Gemmatimonadaceae bacterium]
MDLPLSAPHEGDHGVQHRYEFRVVEPSPQRPELVQEHGELRLVENRVAVRVKEA